MTTAGRKHTQFLLSFNGFQERPIHERGYSHSTLAYFIFGTQLQRSYREQLSRNIRPPTRPT